MIKEEYTVKVQSILVQIYLNRGSKMEQLATLDDLPKRYLGQLEESNLVPLY